MRFCVIASGSKGNLTYIETKQTKVLLDAGVSYKTMEEALNRYNVQLDDIDAIIITHEHSDHIKNLGTYISKTDAILYVNKASYNNFNINLKNRIAGKKVKYIESDTKYIIKDLDIYTLELSHDSACCLGFIFASQNKYLGYATDTGFIQSKYLDLFKICDSLIIEANHDIEMLQMSGRDPMLIRRILSTKGHMSNALACSILKSIVSNKNKCIVLAHISEDCNSLECIQNDIINELLKIYEGKIFIASQYQPLEMIEV